VALFQWLLFSKRKSFSGLPWSFKFAPEFQFKLFHAEQFVQINSLRDAKLFHVKQFAQISQPILAASNCSTWNNCPAAQHIIDNHAHNFNRASDLTGAISNWHLDF
jgi:hypothetical protein